jgi:trans-aconitate 2-methyltransferase
MSWDPKNYMRFANERTRPAAELLARVTNDDPEFVADLGCGPGNSTSLLASRWPKADVEGIESSPEMIAEAKASGVRARWTLADVAQWQPQQRYDVIFSNATLQWLDDHAHLLPRLMGYVRDGGALAVQMPRNFDAPSHALMREVAAAGPWAAKLRDVRKLNVGEPAFYYDILSKLTASLDIWETTYLQVMEGDDPVYRWVSATGLRPFAQALDGEEREAFLSEYRRRLREAYPKRTDGKTLFPFQRIL